MNKEYIYNILTKDIPNSKIYIDENMKKHTSFKIGGNADIFVKATSIDDIKYLLSFAKREDIQLTIIGNGTNLLVKDNGIRGITLQVTMDSVTIEKKDKTAIIKVDAGIKNAILARKLMEESIEGFEFASGIPGNIGGAIRMNAGAYGNEIKDIIQEVTCITKNGEIKTYKKDELEFKYRKSRFTKYDDIILSAVLELKIGDKEKIQEKMKELLNSRKEKQPIEYPNAGSTFKRGNDFITAALIDEAGLKGYKIGGAQISEKHAGFVVNTGNATAQDVLDLIEYVEKTVYEKFKRKIELEIEVIGE